MKLFSQRHPSLSRGSMACEALRFNPKRKKNEICILNNDSIIQKNVIKYKANQTGPYGPMAILRLTRKYQSTFIAYHMCMDKSSHDT